MSSGHRTHDRPRRDRPTAKPNLIGRWAVAAGWAALIFAVSSVPGSGLPGRYGTQAHFVEYAVLSALVYRALRVSAAPWPAALGAIALASCYGITDEIHQAFVPMRVPDVADWAVDTAGAAFGAIIIAVGERLWPSQRRPTQ